MISIIAQEDIKQIVDSLKKESKKLEGSVVLISGGAGFLGSYIIAVIDYLNKNQFAKPCHVISIDNFITGKKRTLFGKIDKKHITLIKHDIKNPLKLTKKIDYIIHAAGIASPIYYNNYPIETMDVAFSGTKHLLELARQKKVKSFLYFSSSEIYGNPDEKFLPTPETYNGNVSTLGPRACYDESKRIGETLCITYNRLFRVPTKIVRPFNVFGPGMYPDDYRVIPNFISHALSNKALIAYNKGLQTRSFCYISDAITGFFKVLLSTKNGEVYNVGNDEKEISMIDLAKEIKKIFPTVKIVVRKHPKNYPEENTDRRFPDITKIRKQLNYTPQVNLRQGIHRFIQWYINEFPEFKKNYVA